MFKFYAIIINDVRATVYQIAIPSDSVCKGYQQVTIGDEELNRRSNFVQTDFNDDWLKARPLSDQKTAFVMGLEAIKPFFSLSHDIL